MAACIASTGSASLFCTALDDLLNTDDTFLTEADPQQRQQQRGIVYASLELTMQALCADTAAALCESGASGARAVYGTQQLPAGPHLVLASSVGVLYMPPHPCSGTKPPVSMHCCGSFHVHSDLDVTTTFSICILGYLVLISRVACT